MLYAIIFALVLSLFCIIFLWPRRTVRLRRIREHGTFFVKLNAEIAIFNRLHVILPKTRRNPTPYIQWLGRLHTNPKTRPPSNDPVATLMYAVAAARLFTHSFDPSRRRQFYKNIVFAFARPHVHRAQIFAFNRPLKLAHRRLFTHRQPLFKYLHTKFIARTPDTQFFPSYVKYENIKHFVGQLGTNHVEVHEILSPHRFSHDFNFDKMKCTFSHTADTFFCTCGHQTTAIHVVGPARVNFETNLADGAEAHLSLYINLKSAAKIHVVRTDTKQAACDIVRQLRGGKAPAYLQSSEQIAEIMAVETLFARAYLSRFVMGEKLRTRQTAAAKIVPTLHLPTLVYDVSDGEELFAVIDAFPHFERIARAGRPLNVVVLYSSQNDIVREFIAAYTNKQNARDLVSSGVFLFFVDRVKANNDAIYYLSLMATPRTTRYAPPDAALHVIARKNVSYALNNKYYKLPATTQLVDEFGAVISPGFDAVCNTVHTRERPRAYNKRCAELLHTSGATTQSARSSRA